MFNFAAAFKALWSTSKAHPIPVFLFLLVIVLFVGAPFYTVYRFVRAKVPGAAALPAK